MQPHMKRREIETTATARDTQTLAYQANQAVFTQKLSNTWRGHQKGAAGFQLLAEIVDTALIDTGDLSPGLQFTLLALQLFEQFCADISAFNHIQ